MGQVGFFLFDPWDVVFLIGEEILKACCFFALLCPSRILIFFKHTEKKKWKIRHCVKCEKNVFCLCGFLSSFMFLFSSAFISFLFFSLLPLLPSCFLCFHPQTCRPCNTSIRNSVKYPHLSCCAKFPSPSPQSPPDYCVLSNNHQVTSIRPDGFECRKSL